MNRVRYRCATNFDLKTELRTPIEKVFVQLGPAGRPLKLFIVRPAGILCIDSGMYELDERNEIGVLGFSKVAHIPSETTEMQVPSSFSGETVPIKLVLEQAGVSAESGIIFAANRSEMYIIPGAYPYSLAISGASQFPHVFEPEFPVESYTRVPFDEANGQWSK